MTSVKIRAGKGGGGVLPYLDYIGYVRPKGYGFSAVLIINKVSVLTILVTIRVSGHK